ncbi:MAG TPA: hypothetical protein ENG09_03795 [Candidatus Syntrophoarchaeum butanivorans]|uniref:Uncharacterized protein n=1 Tax=Candidatus Syntropharchaeum butanivorans TaxID=1839936 RepID=A0A1F2P3W2_9EURY|nr:MAG: hypothetical protein SBU_001122 [Candidatus Syntrophoarchaeum butanivorans]RJS71400.1 MAG: hypothetical protein CW694_05205 [Candidatus Syntrophoarchaeum sp. WYZ-LMO15]HDM36362.1 hypothetical protein [Candidatus Syntrophoarchaeum butanivorans]HEC57764.1 hypothetical protein [Candidatus Syntrophoarchaeum butanivorans]
MRTIVVKGRIDEDLMERLENRLRDLIEGFREVTATHSSTNVVVEEDVWGALKVLTEEGCEIEAIHVWARKVSSHLSL